MTRSNHLDGDKGRLDISREEFRVYMQGSEETTALSRTSAEGFAKATDLHVQNFLESVRSRKPPTAPMALGFQAALVVQMANISIKQGRKVRWDAARQKVDS